MIYHEQHCLNNTSVHTEVLWDFANSYCME